MTVKLEFGHKSKLGGDSICTNASFGGGMSVERGVPFVFCGVGAGVCTKGFKPSPKQLRSHPLFRDRCVHFSGVDAQGPKADACQSTAKPIVSGAVHKPSITQERDFALISYYFDRAQESGLISKSGCGISNTSLFLFHFPTKRVLHGGVILL